MKVRCINVVSCPYGAAALADFGQGCSRWGNRQSQRRWRGPARYWRSDYRTSVRTLRL